jgi:hypothetical protein
MEANDETIRANCQTEMDNQEYEHIQRASTDHATRTTVSNPINELHHGLVLALLQTHFEHAQFQDKNLLRTRQNMEANTNRVHPANLNCW